MKFHPTVQTLSRYVDRDLAEVQERRIEEHLEQCERCRARVQALSEIEITLTVKTPVSTERQPQFLGELPLPTWSDAAVCGELETVRGRVMVSRPGNGKATQAFPGMSLKKGDTVQVLEGSLALVMLDDGSSVFLNEATETRFHAGRHLLSLDQGELFAMMKPQRKPFEIATPAAVLGVIGTEFNARVTEEQKTLLQVLRGKVSFRNKAGQAVVKRNQQVEASGYTRPLANRMRDTQAVAAWTRPLRPKARKRARVGMALSVLLVVLAATIGGGIYWQKMVEQASVAVVQKDLPGEESYVTVEKEVLEVLQNIQRDMQERNLEELATLSLNTCFWRDMTTMEAYLDAELSDNVIGPADYLYSGVPIKIISSGKVVTVVLSEPWYGSTCKLYLVKLRGQWIVSDIFEMEGFGYYIEHPPYQEILPLHDTTGMSGEEVIRGFYEAMIAKDTDSAVGYLTFPNDESRVPYRNMLDIVLRATGVSELREVRVSNGSALVRFGVTRGFPGAGVARWQDERQGRLYLRTTPSGLKIETLRSSILGDSLADYE